MCSRDILFWVNSFIWTYDPKKFPDNPFIPFITYPYQDDAIVKLNHAVGRHDVTVEKSRDMGASWICLMVFLWRFQFRPGQTFLVSSRKEALVDKKGDPDCLFWKLDKALGLQPRWLRPAVDRAKLQITNLENGSTIGGESTTENLATGGRRTAVMLDEFSKWEKGYEVLSSTADVTDCRIFNSTPKGSGNAFYKKAHDGTFKLRFHWSQHPLKAKGLYRTPQGKLRSPWYDAECVRRTHPAEIAQELDIDYLGSDYQFFDPQILDDVATRYVRSPFEIGDVLYDPDSFEPIEFRSWKNGKLRVWCSLDGQKKPPPGKYILGADISAGSGASNTAFAVLDPKTGEKVAEWASSNVMPHYAAHVAIALCRWFCDVGGKPAYMIWERNGTGGEIFGQTVRDSGFRHVYYQTDEAGRRSDKIGFHTNENTKAQLLGDYRRALESGDFINRSYIAIDECRHYVYTSAGKIMHSSAAGSEDPTGAGAQHGDRVVADALSWWGARERPHRRVEAEPAIPLGSFADRRSWPKVDGDWRRQELVESW